VRTRLQNGCVYQALKLEVGLASRGGRCDCRSHRVRAKGTRSESGTCFSTSEMPCVLRQWVSKSGSRGLVRSTPFGLPAPHLVLAWVWRGAAARGRAGMSPRLPRSTASRYSPSRSLGGGALFASRRVPAMPGPRAHLVFKWPSRQAPLGGPPSQPSGMPWPQTTHSATKDRSSFYLN
jgi:hypothetical protein